MLMFGVTAAILLGFAAFWWFSSIKMTGAASEQEQNALALEQINIYRLRLKELAFERRYDELDEAEYDGSVKALKQQLLFDLKAQNQKDKRKQYALFVPGAVFLAIFVGAFYFANGQSQKLEDWHKSIELLPQLGAKAGFTEGQVNPSNLTKQELQQLALGLRSQLHEVGDDAIVWLLLGQTLINIGDFDGAMQAMDKSYQLDPMRESTLLNYAQLLLMSGNQWDLRKAATMLARVLQRNPQQVEAMLMVGLVAERMNDVAQQKASWQSVLKVMSDNDPRKPFVTEKLAKIGSAAPAVGNAVMVNITLDEAIKDKIPAGAVLFVYAKAPSGKPMPAAVVRLEQFELPMRIELSDNNAMLPDYKLSSLEDAVIFARVSIDANIAVAPGELQGQTAVLKLKDTKEVSLVIDQLL